MAPNAPSMVPVVCECILVGPGHTAMLQTPCQQGQDPSAWSQLYPENEGAPHGHSDAGEVGCCLVTGYLAHPGPVLGADSTAIVSRNCHSNPPPPPLSRRKPGRPPAFASSHGHRRCRSPWPVPRRRPQHPGAQVSPQRPSAWQAWQQPQRPSRLAGVGGRGHGEMGAEIL